MTTELVRALSGDLAVLRSHAFDRADPFWSTAEAHRVHLLIAAFARATDAISVWSTAAAGHARAADVDAIATQALRDHELRRVLDRLGAGGVSCLLMKGAAIAHTHYPSPHLRPRSDTDILIPADAAARAATILQADGYQQAVETSGALATFQSHFFRDGAVGTLHALDMHTRIANPQVFAHSVDYETLAAARVAIPALGSWAFAPAPGHALVLACIHHAAHHPGADHLLWLWDLHLLAAALDEVESDRFVQMASRAAMREVCARTLVLAAPFGETGVRSLVSRVRPAADELPEPSAQFLAGGLRLVDILALDLAALAWRDRVSLLREHMFPSRAYMRSMYRDWPTLLLPAAYLHRLVSGVPKWLRRR